MDAANHRRPILTHQIASRQTYYAAVNERTVYLQGAPEVGFSLYGGIPSGSEACSVNLAEVLLEFAMAWNAPGDAPEARRQMRVFGKRLGEALANHRARVRPVNGVLGRPADALEDVFRSLDASFAYRHTESEVRYQLDPCPLRVAAEVTGMEREAELAHYALNAIYQSVVGALDPELRLRLPRGPNVQQVISVLAPSSNGRWPAERSAGTWTARYPAPFRRHDHSCFNHALTTLGLIKARTEDDTKRGYASQTDSSRSYLADARRIRPIRRAGG